MPGLQSELRFEFDFTTGFDLDAGEAGPNGIRMAAEMTNGRFEGPLLRGTLVEGSAVDWMHRRPDGAGSADGNDAAASPQATVVPLGQNPASSRSTRHAT